MKTLVSILLITLFAPIIALSQWQGTRFDQDLGPERDLDSLYSDFSNRKVMQYTYVRKADVMMKKEIWEYIDLNEKFNLPLYYPTDTTGTVVNRYSLMQALLIATKKFYEDPNRNPSHFAVFNRPIRDNGFEFQFNNRFESVKELIDLRMDSLPNPNFTNPGPQGRSKPYAYIRWKTAEVTKILVKEVWYFDRKDSRMRCEIIGVCPIRQYYNQAGNIELERLCWFYYPYLRPYLAKIPVYNPLNDKPLYSFDDVFVNRFYRSYFVQKSNVFNDRMITDYVLDRDAQLESDRIKQELFDWEQDLWEN